MFSPITHIVRSTNSRLWRWEHGHTTSSIYTYGLLYTFVYQELNDHPQLFTSATVLWLLESLWRFSCTTIPYPQRTQSTHSDEAQCSQIYGAYSASHIMCYLLSLWGRYEGVSNFKPVQVPYLFARLMYLEVDVNISTFAEMRWRTEIYPTYLY